MNASRRRPWLLWTVLALVALGLAWGIWNAMANKRRQNQQMQAQQALPPATLKVPASDWMTLTPRTLEMQVPVSGTLQAVDRAVVRSRVAGEIMDLQLREGDSVRKGQVIARVDATDSEARYRQARLQADAAKAQVAIQQRQHENNQALVDRQFISPTALATSAANLQAAQANFAAAQAAADAARKVLDDTVLKAPIDGQISQRWVQNGERINVEASVVEVVNLSQLELEAPLPAADSLHVQLQQTAHLRVEGNATPMTATVVRISPTAADGSRAVPVYLRLQKDSTLQLRPGVFVEGYIATGAVNALAVPLNAVRNDQPQPYVQTVMNGLVAHQPVTMGVRTVVATKAASDASPNTGEVWVAIEGIAPNTPVLLASAGALPAGTRIELMSASSTAAVTATP